MSRRKFKKGDIVEYKGKRIDHYNKLVEIIELKGFDAYYVKLLNPSRMALKLTIRRKNGSDRSTNDHYLGKLITTNCVPDELFKI